jgi:hypothetical protein
MNLQPRTRERRSGASFCAHVNGNPKPCRSIPAWRCQMCATVVCGVHIVRNAQGAICKCCGNYVERFRKRLRDRRAT